MLRSAPSILSGRFSGVMKGPFGAGRIKLLWGPWSWNEITRYNEHNILLLVEAFGRAIFVHFWPIATLGKFAGSFVIPTAHHFAVHL